MTKTGVIVIKKLIAVLLALCLTAITLIPAFAAEQAGAVIDGTWKILVSGSDTAQANYAAEKIQSALADALGVTLSSPKMPATKTGTSVSIRAQRIV